MPATGAAFESERDFVELDECHSVVDIANCYSHHDYSRTIHARQSLLHSTSKGVERRPLRWLAELPGAKVATRPALGGSHRPSSNYYVKNGQTAVNNFSQIAVEAEKIESAALPH